jgi:hypothetical protein
MKPTIRAIDAPLNSDIAKMFPDAYFFDAYGMPLKHEGRSALEIYLNVIGKTPAWVDFLMALRNRVVGLFGLKNLGALGELKKMKAAVEYRIGDRVGIFSLISMTDNEIILGDSDKHLDVKVSLCKLNDDAEESVAITTVVHIHNLLGRVYMLFVTPFHRIIAPAVLARAAK